LQGLEIRLFIRPDNELLASFRAEFDFHEIHIVRFDRSSFFVFANLLFKGRPLFKKFSHFLLPDTSLVIPMPGIFEMLILKVVKDQNKVFTVIHDPFRHKGDFLPRNFMIKYLYRNCKNLIYFSNYTAKELEDRYGPRLLPQFVTQHPIPSLASRTEGHQKISNNYILLIGRNRKYQNFNSIVNLWFEESYRFPNLDLIIAGQNSSSFTSTAHRVFTESRWLSEIEFGNLLANASAVILPYTQASQSGPASLAIGLGKCILYSRVGGLVEQLSDYDLGFPFSNRSELLESLELIYASPKFKALNNAKWEDSWTDLLGFISGGTLSGN
jgi:hypothetical protein